METFLLKWNPSKWPWVELSSHIEQMRRDGSTTEVWSCGRTKRIEAGDRILFLRVSEAPKGIIGVGTVQRPPWEMRHWDSDRAAAGETCHFIEIQFQRLSAEPFMDADDLSMPPFDRVHWFNQASAIRIPDEIADAVVARVERS